MRRGRRQKWHRPVPPGTSPGDTVYWRAADVSIIGTHAQLEEVVNEMARVEGAKGTINEGVIGDVPVVEGLDLGDTDELWAPTKEPSATVDRLAQAIVRGDEGGNPFNPVDAAAAKRLKVHDRAHDIVLTGDTKAKKGDHILSKPSDEGSAEAKEPVEEKKES